MTTEEGAPVTDHPVISLNDVTVRFDGAVTAVESLSFHLSRGERVAVLGQTGAGKSTVLNLIIGALRPTTGTVRVDGLDPVRQWKQMQGHIAMAFQSPRLLPWRTALDNVTIGLEILHIGREERLRRGREWLERVHLGGAADRYPAQLSGGMRQRVALARAFAVEPAVLLLDESFSALDEVTAQNLRTDFVEAARNSGTSALIVTHNIAEAFEVADRVLVLTRPAKVAAEIRSADHDFEDPVEMSRLRTEVQQIMAADTLTAAS